MSEQEFELYLKLLSRCLGLTAKQREQIADELRDHLQERLDELAGQGVPRERAVLQALDEFGDAAVLAAHFTTIAHLRRRRLLMRLSLGSVAALTAGILIAVAFWPENRPLNGPALAVAQEKPKAPTVPTPTPAPAAAASRRAVEPQHLLSSDEMPYRNKTAERIQLALEETVDFVIEPQSLKDALKFIAQRFNIPIVIDMKALSDANMDDSADVHSAVQGIRLKNALKLMLEQMPQPLSFTVEDEVLKITTRQKAREERVEVVVYDCRDLVHLRSIETGEHSQPVRVFDFGQFGAQEKPLAEANRDQKASSESATHLRSSKTDAKPAESTTARRQPTHVTRSASTIPLIRVIENATDPEQWMDNGGGPGTITEFGGLLIVRQTRAIHEEIKHVLADIRQMIKEGAFARLDQQTGGPATPNPSSAAWEAPARPAAPEN